MADFIADVGGKVYFVIVHASLFFLGAYIIRKKVKEIEEKKKDSEFDYDTISFDALATEGIKYERNTCDQKVSHLYDNYINTVVEWCYLQPESSVKLLFECWVNNTERELRKEFTKNWLNPDESVSPNKKHFFSNAFFHFDQINKKLFIC